MHYDGSALTWSLCLSDSKSEYTGGGTYFRSLRKTLGLKQGQVLVHPGDLSHKGVDITTGERMLLVCFLDGYDTGVKDGSTDRDYHPSFEKDVLQL